MTHDELLTKIKNNGTLETQLVCTCPHKEVVEIETRPHRNDLALRAVVELHVGAGLNNRCVSCANDTKCETIQVIEKALA